MKKIRVLQVTGGLGTGGIERVAVNFYKKINRDKYEMDYLVYGDKIGEYEKEVKELGARIIRVPQPKKGYFEFYKNVCKVIKDYGPYDIVHTHVLFNSGIIVRAAHKNRIPMIISHSHDNLNYTNENILKKIYYFIMRKWLLRYSTKLCACATNAGNFLFGEKAFNKKGIVLLNAIDINKFKYNEQKRIKIRKEFNIKDDEIILGNIGRLDAQKNQEYLLKILKNINNSNKNYKLLLIGDGKLKEYLTQKIKIMGLEEKVIMTGNRSDITDLLSAMDLFVLTSIHEGAPVVLAEAQTNGLSCLAPEKIVPIESKILDNFKFMPNPIDKNLDLWISEIKRCSNRIEDVDDIIKKSGYDIEMLGAELERLYN